MFKKHTKNFMNNEEKAHVLSPAPHFIQKGFESSLGNWSKDQEKDIEILKHVHPEIRHWGTLAVGLAWSEYSQDIHLIFLVLCSGCI